MSLFNMNLITVTPDIVICNTFYTFVLSKYTICGKNDRHKHIYSSTKKNVSMFYSVYQLSACFPFYTPIVIFSCTFPIKLIEPHFKILINKYSTRP